MKLLLLIVITANCAAQELPNRPRVHSFSDRKNVIMFASLAATMAADAYSTQRGFRKYPPGGNVVFIERNPIARPFVKQGAAGQFIISAATFALVVEGSRYLHRRQHHRLERVLPIAWTAVSGYLAYRNMKY